MRDEEKERKKEREISEMGKKERWNEKRYRGEDGSMGKSDRRTEK